jgi:hypothetical protein
MCHYNHRKDPTIHDAVNSQLVLAIWINTIVLPSSAICALRASQTRPNLGRELFPGALLGNLTILSPSHAAGCQALEWLPVSPCLSSNPYPTRFYPSSSTSNYEWLTELHRENSPVQLIAEGQLLSPGTQLVAPGQLSPVPLWETVSVQRRLAASSHSIVHSDQTPSQSRIGMQTAVSSSRTNENGGVQHSQSSRPTRVCASVTC